MNEKFHKHRADTEELRKLMAKANDLYKQGKYDEALQANKRLLDFMESTFDPGSPEVARRIAECLTIIAGLYVQTGDKDEEAQYFLLRLMKMGTPPGS